MEKGAKLKENRKTYQTTQVIKEKLGQAKGSRGKPRHRFGMRSRSPSAVVDAPILECSNSLSPRASPENRLSLQSWETTVKLRF